MADAGVCHGILFVCIHFVCMIWCRLRWIKLLRGDGGANAFATCLDPTAAQVARKRGHGRRLDRYLGRARLLLGFGISKFLFVSRVPRRWLEGEAPSWFGLMRMRVRTIPYRSGDVSYHGRVKLNHVVLEQTRS
jgi:hypothetical protein